MFSGVPNGARRNCFFLPPTSEAAIKADAFTVARAMQGPPPFTLTYKCFFLKNAHVKPDWDCERKGRLLAPVKSLVYTPV